MFLRELYDAISLSEGLLQNPHRFEEACKWIFLGYVRAQQVVARREAQHGGVEEGEDASGENVKKGAEDEFDFDDATAVPKAFEDLNTRILKRELPSLTIEQEDLDV